MARTIAPGERLLAEDLKAKGYTVVSVTPAMVRFTGPSLSAADFYQAFPLCVRYLRVLHKAPARDADQLYKVASMIPWERLIGVNHSFAVRATGDFPQELSPKFAPLKVKDAIADRVAQNKGRRPSVDVKQPQRQVFLHFYGGTAELSIDFEPSLGGIKKGYRSESGRAPINETLAHLLVRLSEGELSGPILDPFCGSGTILIEAARFFQFNGLNPVPMMGLDQSHSSIEQAKANAERAGVSEYISWYKQDFFSSGGAMEALMARHDMGTGPGLIISNPPYGERLSLESVRHWYQELATLAKQRFPHWTMGLITPQGEATRGLGFKAQKSWKVLNGGMACTYGLYPILPPKA